MSDQVYDDPGAQDSHEADVDAGFDKAEESTATPGLPGVTLPEEQDDTSHEADIEAGYDDGDAESSGAGDQDRHLDRP